MAAIARAKLGDGVPLHGNDMRRFDLGHRFDAVTCLFSSIGYLRTADELASALAAMARHPAWDGVLVVDPWFFPDAWLDGHVTALAASDDGGADRPRGAPATGWAASASSTTTTRSPPARASTASPSATS